MKVPISAYPIFVILFLHVCIANGQNSVVIGGTTPNPSAVLTLIGNGSQALIIPAAADHNTITKSAGMLVYNSTDKTIYYCDGTTWKSLSGSQSLTPGTGISITGSTIANTGDTNAGDDITNATTAGGDLSGNYPNPTVSKIRGVNVANTAPATNQILQFNGTNWVPATLPAAVSLPAITSGQLITNNGTANVGVTVSGDATFNQSGALTIGTGAVNSLKISDGSIATGDIAGGAITGGTAGVIADGTITNADISATAGIGVNKLAPGSSGQVLTVIAGAAAWQAPASTTLDGLTDATIATPAGGQVLVNDGAGQFRNTTISGDVAINNTGVATIQPGAISGGTAGKITDGTITNADISSTATIAGTKITPNFGTQDLITTGKTTFNTVTNTWPNAQGAANTFLRNDGVGNLIWSPTPSPYSTVNTVPIGDGVGMTDSQISSVGLNVGIGVNSPAHRLTLYNETDYSLLSIQSATTGTGFSDGIMMGLDDNTGNAVIWNWETGKYIRFGTSGSERLSIDGTGRVAVAGFTKLGSDAPAIKVKKILGTTAATEGAQVSFPTGIASDKIISITVLVEYAPGYYLDQAYVNNSGYQFNWFGGPSITVWNTTGNSFFILSKPVKILVTYEE